MILDINIDISCSAFRVIPFSISQNRKLSSSLKKMSVGKYERLRKPENVVAYFCVFPDSPFQLEKIQDSANLLVHIGSDASVRDFPMELCYRLRRAWPYVKEEEKRIRNK